MADLAGIQVTKANGNASSGLSVEVSTDHPLEACIGSQYAGWPVSVGKYFAMGSGPMRSVRGKEEVLRNIPEEDGIHELIRLIKEDGQWVEPEEAKAAAT